MTPDRSGVFSSVFDSADGYLDLLHLDSHRGLNAVSSVVKCCHASPNPHLEIVRLLDDANWRPHIVAAVAVSALEYDHKSVASLWAAFDAGSWVTPQLAVAACLRDPNFSESARVRILARCPIEPSRLSSMSPVQRHSATGPAGARARSAKAAASLVQLASVLRAIPQWLTTERSAPDLVALLSEDVDGSAKIAEDWLDKLRAILKALGIELV